MGIKWWFRKRIVFEHDNEIESIVRPGRSSQQNISVATTGIYRATKDIDNFEVIDRPKTLPPVKIRPGSGQFLPIRHSYDKNKANNDNERPIPEEIIPIPVERIQQPPSTPISPVRDDFSKPIVIDIDIPGERDYVLQTDNELSKPEIHQTLTLNESNIKVDEIEVIAPEPKARNKPKIVESPIKERQDKDLPVQENAVPIFETVKIKSKDDNLESNHIDVVTSEIIASSEKLNEFEAYIEQERKELEKIKVKSKSNEISVTSNFNDEKISTEVKEKENVEVDDTQNLNETVEIHEIETSPIIKTFTIDDEPPKSEKIVEEKKSPEPNPITDDPLDVSKIVSPKPRMRKGILKKKAPPIPIALPLDEVKENLNPDQEPGIIRWTDTNPTKIDDIPTENVEIRSETTNKKGVKFDNNEPDIIPRPDSILGVKQLIELINEQEKYTNISEDEASPVEELKPIINEIKAASIQTEPPPIVVNGSVEEIVKVEENSIQKTEPLNENIIEIEEKSQVIIDANTDKEIDFDSYDKIVIKAPIKVIEDGDSVKIVLLDENQMERTVSESETDEIIDLRPESPNQEEPTVNEITLKEEESEKNSSQDLTETVISINEVSNEPEIDEKVKIESEYSENTLELNHTSINDLKTDPIQNFEENEAKKPVQIESQIEENTNPEPPTKKPVTTPRKFVKIIDTKPEKPDEINIEEKQVKLNPIETWEPQTIIHNDQILVMTPPPNYPPPMLPNSYLSDDSDESVTSEEYDENHPPKPPKRYRIYVVNSDNGENKVKPILKNRPPLKKVAFDSASPDVFLRSPDSIDSADTPDREGLLSPLMPNMMINDLSPKIRSTPNEMLNDAEKSTENTLIQIEDETPNEVKSPNKLTKIPLDPILFEKTISSLNDSLLIPTEIQQEPVDEKILDIQSPLDEKIAMFKALAEKLHESPVKSPDTEFEKLLGTETIEHDKPSMNLDINVPQNSNSDEKSEISDEKTVKNEKIPPQPVPRPTSLFFNSLNDTNNEKPKVKSTRRQLSEPVLSPRDALMAEIKNFGQHKKLVKRETPIESEPQSNEVPKKKIIEVDIEEALI
uniref:CSON004621 protein n=1 Tax=Culicoides sonorensis TaxID=179676 RepID=A0A336L7V3_CULSO